MTLFICAGCKQPIMERYLMKVLDKSWHVQCVKCSDCQSLLSEKCFSRESKLYCRNHFFKRYGTKCAGCNSGLCPEDLVRRAVNRIYHIDCFACNVCQVKLSTGEQVYCIQGRTLMCESCYRATIQSVGSTEAPPPVPALQKPESRKHVSSPLQEESPAVDSKKHKPRTSINPLQLELLTAAYNKEQRPSKHMREALMAKTGLDMKVIQVWFQNRRSKDKRDASYNNKEDLAGGAAAKPTTPASTPTTADPVVSSAGASASMENTDTVVAKDT